jgi:hypothetical protein
VTPVSLTDWQTYLSVQAGAAAALTGLVFVSVSINLDKIISLPGVSTRAAESLLQFLGAFFISTVALVPGQPLKALAAEFILIGLVSCGIQVVGQLRFFPRAGRPWSWIVYRVVLTQLATVPFCISGIALLIGSPAALDWLIPGFFFSFVAGVFSAWVLLVEILR